MNAHRKWALGLGAVVVLAALPAFFGEHHMHIFIQILLFAYLSYCWNILGGFAGQL